MSEHEAFEGILASLHDAALDHSDWPTAARHIDDALDIRLLPLSDCPGKGAGENRRLETSTQHCPSGSIKPNMGWRH